MTTNNAINRQFPFNKVFIQTFAAGTSTYTPTSGMQYCTVQIVGGGGSGGGVTGGVASQASAGASGGGAGYCYKIYTAAQIGATATVVVGSGGAGAASGANNGNAGGTSTFTPTGAGVVLTATGGGAGASMATSAAAQVSIGGTGGTGTNGDINVSGSMGSNGVTQAAGVLAYSGASGGSMLGMNSSTVIIAVSGGANNDIGTGFGSGSTGTAQINSGNFGSSAAKDGVCIVTEYVSS